MIIKKRQFQMQLNNIKQNDDPTKLYCSFIIFDFNPSENNGVISEELALEIAPTIFGMPIVTKYHPVEEPNTPTDALGDHEAYLGENRYGNQQVKLNTIPIGTFTSEGYVMDYETPSGDTVKVLAADAILWKSRFSDACDLIVEWFNNDINVNTSCEILYKNFTFKDGIEYMESPAYFEGHAVLNSEDRGDHSVVLPAYTNAKLLSLNQIKEFGRLVAQAIIKEGNEEGEGMTMFRKVFELSHNDIRSLIYKAYDETLAEGTYSYITEVYDDNFIINEYSDDADKYFKINYAKDGDSITIDVESKVEVFLKRDWVEVSTTELQSQLNTLTTEKEALSSKVEELSDLETQLNSVKTEKEAIEGKFNTATETIVQLNSKIEEFKPIQEKLVQEQYEKALNEKKETYAAKFEAVGAKEQFESEEVQTLLASSIVEGDEGKDALLQLNSIIVDLVNEDLINKSTSNIRSLSSRRENLIPPTEDDFVSRFS